MAIRFTDTDKWMDSWFSSLSAKGKLLFLFLCDNCNIAGIIEVNKGLWATFTSLSISDIDKALKEIEKCYILSTDEECIFIKNFLKHQKNYPINLNNKAHVKILSLYDRYRHKFDSHDIDELLVIDDLRGIKGGLEGDRTPTGNGIGIDNGIKGGVGENDLKKIEDEFKKSIEPYLQKYGREMCNDFYMYWTEPNKSKTKLRFEMQKTWDVGRRLVTWSKNNQKYNKPISATQKVSETEYKEF